MENLKQILYEKQLELEEIEKTNKKTLERLPEGYANISKNKNSIHLYQGDGNVELKYEYESNACN